MFHAVVVVFPSFLPEHFVAVVQFSAALSLFVFSASVVVLAVVVVVVSAVAVAVTPAAFVVGTCCIQETISVYHYKSDVPSECSQRDEDI